MSDSKLPQEMHVAMKKSKSKMKSKSEESQMKSMKLTQKTRSEDKVDKVEDKKEKRTEKTQLTQQTEKVEETATKSFKLPILFEISPEKPMIESRGTVEVKIKNTCEYPLEMLISLYSVRMRLQNSQICDNNSTVHRVAEPGATATVTIRDTGIYCGYKSDRPMINDSGVEGELVVHMMAAHPEVKEMKVDEYKRVCDRELGSYGCNKHIKLQTPKKPRTQGVGWWDTKYTMYVMMEPETASYKEHVDYLRRFGMRQALVDAMLVDHIPKPANYVPAKTEESMKARADVREARIKENLARDARLRAKNRELEEQRLREMKSKSDTDSKAKKRSKCTIS